MLRTERKEDVQKVCSKAAIQRQYYQVSGQMPEAKKGEGEFGEQFRFSMKGRGKNACKGKLVRDRHELRAGLV